MIFTFILIMLLSVAVLALGFVVSHFSKTHKAASKNSLLLQIAGWLLILGGVLSFALNVYIYEKFRAEGKIEQILPFEIAIPLSLAFNIILARHF